ncbi:MULTISPECIES: hypothetical protein [Paenibacillus]|nr:MULTISPECIES: hypothetical protein [Paenibacillus]
MRKMRKNKGRLRDLVEQYLIGVTVGVTAGTLLILIQRLLQ